MKLKGLFLISLIFLSGCNIFPQDSKENSSSTVIPSSLDVFGKVEEYPNILLISVSSFSFDYAKNTFVYKSLVSEGVEFTNFYTQINHVLPVHVTLFTGLSPLRHGIINSIPEGSNNYVRQFFHKLLDLQYKTVGFYSTPFLSPESGLIGGFTVYRDSEREFIHVDSIVDRTVRIIDFHENRSDPLFIFMQISDLAPDPPANGNKLPYFLPPSLKEKLKIKEDMFCFKGMCADKWLQFYRTRKLSKDALAALKTVYKAQVDYLDKRLGDFFGWLREDGWLEKFVVIFTADYGEEFGEYGSLSHYQLSPSVAKIPLVIRFPNAEFKGKKVDALVSHADIAAFIEDYLGVDLFSDIDGKSFLPLLRDERSALSAFAARKVVGIEYDSTLFDRFVIINLPFFLSFSFSSGKSNLYKLDRSVTLEDRKGIIDSLKKDLLEIIKKEASLKSEELKEAINKADKILDEHS